MQVRLAIHTLMYIVSVWALVCAAINPAGTARFLRRHTVKLAAAVRTVSDTATATTTPVVAASEFRGRPVEGQTRPRGGSRPGEYRVAINTVLTARLRTPIDSRTAQVNEQIDAVLTDPVRQDGVELIPAGSVLHGTIVQAEAATKDAPLGRVEMIFTVVQHADTQSRAAIRTRPLAFQAEPPAEIAGRRRAPKRQPIDIALAAGHPLLLTMGDALIVYIPNPR